MELKVVLMECFDPNNITFSKVKNNRIGNNKKSYITYNDIPFFLVLSNTKFSHGAVSKWTDEGNMFNKEHWAVICQLDDEYVEKFQIFDKKIVDHVMNTPEILACLNLTDPSREKVQSLYKSTLRGGGHNQSDQRHSVVSQKLSNSPKNLELCETQAKPYLEGFTPPGLYSAKPLGIEEHSMTVEPTLKVNIAGNRGNGFMCAFFNKNPQPLAFINSNRRSPEFIKNLISAGSNGSILFGMSLWINPTGFGVNLRAEQIKVESNVYKERTQSLSWRQNNEQQEICLLD